MKTVRRLFLILLGLFLAANVQAETAGLPLGDWDICANGYVGTLTITSVAQGKLTGTFREDLPITGFWDPAGNRITFLRVTQADDQSTTQIFTGFLFKDPGDGRWTLAGSFEGFAGTGATNKRPVYGWYAKK